MECPKCHFENPEDTQYCGKCATPLQPSKKSSVSTTETLQMPMRELSIGSTFARRYQVIEDLGKGGMGQVYKVLDKEIEEKVALKILKPEIVADEKTIKRFRNELKFARKISHKNICRMYDLNKEERIYYITMEYVPGEDLKSTIRRVGRLSGAKAISITKQVCEGLAEAHKMGLVHRDLKPQNIMVDREGNARIMDFGIARSLKTKGITTTGMMIGTPEYMSPEQAEGKEVDQRSDVYSLGVTLYEMVTGKVPFEGDTPLSIAFKHKTEMPPNPKEINAQIPEDLSRVILKCMEKEKEKRYQTSEELLSDLIKIEKSIPTRERVLPKRKLITLKEITVKFRLKKVFIPGLIFFVFALCFIAVWLFNRSAKIRWARKEAVPEIVQNIRDKNYIAAFRLAKKAEKYISTDPLFAKLWPEMSRKISVQTSPPGADVYIKDEKTSDSKWEYLGEAPIDSIKIPIGFFRWKIEKEGHETVEEVNSGSSGLLHFTLDKEGRVPVRAKIFEIKEITEDGKIVKIDGGTEDRIKKGYTGGIYYGKELGNDIKRWFIAQFFVKDVNRDESRIEIADQKEKIKQGYLVEFDKEIKGTFIIDTEPDGANIFINNDYKGSADLKLILEPADYMVKIKTINYKEEIDNVNIKPGDIISKTYRLTPLTLPSQLGTLKVNSVPPGAEIYFGNRKKPEGRTPFEKNLLPRKYSVKIKMENYKEQIREIDIKAGKIISRTYTLAPKEGILEIDSTPQGAEVYFGDTDIPEGTTPFNKSLPPGHYKIKVKKEGFEVQEDEFTVNPGGAVPKIYHLNQLPPSPIYTIIINTEPEEAVVTINNDKKEKMTPVKIELTGTEIQLKIEKEGYRTVEDIFNLKEQFTMKNYTLEKLGKGMFIITAYPQAALEIDGKPIEGRVPPMKTVEVTEGDHKIKFIFEESVVIEKEESIKEGETKRVHCDLEDHKQILAQKCMYELSAYPHADIKIDGSSFGTIPPLKTVRIDNGIHKIEFTFREEFEQYVVIEIDDLIAIKGKKKIHLISVISDFKNLEDSDFPEEYLDKLRNDWIKIKSNPTLEVEINGISQGEVSSSRELKLLEMQKNTHRIKLMIKKSGRNYKTEINIFKIEKKKCYKIEISIEML